MAEEQKTEELSEEAKLAQEALDATPETPAEKPEFPKEAIDQITSLRTERTTAREGRRVAELDAARKQGELDALRQAQAVQEKSPMEKAAEKQECSMDEVQMTGKLYRDQQAFEASHASAKSEQETYARQERQYNAGLGTIPAAERDELIATGGHLLTDGDKQNIWQAGTNSGKELKRILTFRIEQANLQPSAEADKKKTEKTDKSTAEEKAKKEAEEKAKGVVPTQEEVLKDKKLDEEYKALTFA